MRAVKSSALSFSWAPRTCCWDESDSPPMRFEYLERQLESCLYLPGRVDLLQRDSAERAGSDVRHGPGELNTVECIEQLASKFKAGPLAESEVLRDQHVPV